MKKTISTLAITLLLTTGWAGTPAINFTSADINPAYNFNFSGCCGGPGGFALGYQFTTSQALTVVQLGFYDDYGNGLAESHAVGLYSFTTGTLLTSATVTPSDPLSGVFRFTPISPLTIGPGSYSLMSVQGFVDNYTHDPNSITIDPNITFGQNLVLYGSNGVLGFSTFSESSPILTYGWFGPNMVTQLAAPEPPTYLILAGIGVMTLLLGRRHRKKA